MKSCTVIKQTNGLYTLRFEKTFLYFFPYYEFKEDMTEKEVRNYEIPWCKISFNTKVPIHVYPKRIIT